jgi:hypothetical protein
MNWGLRYRAAASTSPPLDGTTRYWSNAAGVFNVAQINYHEERDAANGRRDDRRRKHLS